MKQWWWKFLAVGLVLIASIAALRTPLAPAVVHASEGALKPGPNTVTVLGYATRFTQESPRVFVENGGQFIAADQVEVLDDRRITARFLVPEGLREDMSDLLVSTTTQGTMRLFDAFYNPEKGSGALEGVTEGPPRTERTDFAFPNRNILYESIRNLHFHVPMWFTMMLLQTIALVFSISVLGSGNPLHDRGALAAVHVSLLFAGMGLLTGSLWARATWGGWWTSDAKLNGAAVTVLIYLAYLVLRGSVNDPAKRARLAAIYNVFAYVLMLLFIMALPRMTASLHPGSGGNPAFSQYDLDDSLRPVFYAAVLGWMGIGTWLLNLQYRLARIEIAHDHAHHR
ncbi:MAG: cytochrome c biogenesis protein CcsA [Flavobacteriales bacterium]|nr:cytochrome c biogenesis protein CcsA [Flavobacteriales bacterium]